MRTHLAGLNLRTRAAVCRHADEQVTAASIVKLPVMIHVLQTVDAGVLPLAVVAPLVRPMIAVSSNEATNALLDLVGLDGVQRTCASLGMGSTVVARRMMDMDARAAGRENLTTAADVLALLEALAGGSLLSATSQAFAMDCLLAQEFAGLPAPAGFTFAHKTGELAGVRHDAGILIDRAGPAAVARGPVPRRCRRGVPPARPRSARVGQQGQTIDTVGCQSGGPSQLVARNLLRPYSQTSAELSSSLGLRWERTRCL